MNHQQKSENSENKTDVTRSQQDAAAKGANTSGEEQRPEGSEQKSNPEHHHGSHREGQAPHQSDDPTMHPSDMDEER